MWRRRRDRPPDMPREPRRPPSSPDPYTPASFRGTLVMLAAILAGLAAVWIAYGWALEQWSPP